MPQNGLIYRVLVASPSDCIQERKLLPEILYAWNAAHSLPHGAVLEPILWETHARPGMGDRPQALINAQLVDHCDILIGTFWTRLGTSTGKAPSGTAEEIEEFREKGKPVLLYFSSAPVVPESLDPTQYQALTEYRKSLDKQGLYFNYDSLEQLRQLVQGHIAGTMAQIHSSVPTPIAADDAETDDKAIFKRQFDSFLRRLDIEWSSERDSDPMGTKEAKRILSNALNDVLSFRAQIISGLQAVSGALEDAARDLRAIQRHQLYMDGGASFRAFFEFGDNIIAKLRTVPDLVDANKPDA